VDLSVQKLFRDACLKHGRHLLECARQIQGHSPHVAYHLATLALEEIGKSLLIRFPREEDDQSSTPLIDKHLKKLFWALYAPLLYERIEKRQVEEAREFALRIHRTRLAGLYVEWKDGKVFDPKDTVSPDQCSGLISMVETRLRMEENIELRQLTPEDDQLVRWFVQVSADPEKSRYVFGRDSLDKLAELKDSKGWFLWLKTRFDSFDRESQEFMVRELNRQRPDGDDRAVPKWRVRIRLRSLSHSIRQKSLNDWNAKVTHIKLSRADNKTLPQTSP
jgi:AbiV family abortive infection protein